MLKLFMMLLVIGGGYYFTKPETLPSKALMKFYLRSDGCCQVIAWWMLNGRAEWNDYDFFVEKKYFYENECIQETEMITTGYQYFEDAVRPYRSWIFRNSTWKPFRECDLHTLRYESIEADIKAFMPLKEDEMIAPEFYMRAQYLHIEVENGLLPE
jgi:hypothetical protein